MRELNRRKPCKLCMNFTVHSVQPETDYLVTKFMIVEKKGKSLTWWSILRFIRTRFYKTKSRERWWIFLIWMTPPLKIRTIGALENYMSYFLTARKVVVSFTLIGKVRKLLPWIRRRMHIYIKFIIFTFKMQNSSPLYSSGGIPHLCIQDEQFIMFASRMRNSFSLYSRLGIPHLSAQDEEFIIFTFRMRSSSSLHSRRRIAHLCIQDEEFIIFAFKMRNSSSLHLGGGNVHLFTQDEKSSSLHSRWGIHHLCIQDEEFIIFAFKITNSSSLHSRREIHHLCIQNEKFIISAFKRRKFVMFAFKMRNS